MWDRDPRRPDYRDDRPRYPDTYSSYASSSRRGPPDHEHDRYAYPRARDPDLYDRDSLGYRSESAYRKREREFDRYRDWERRRVRPSSPRYREDVERERYRDLERDRMRERDQLEVGLRRASRDGERDRDWDWHRDRARDRDRETDSEFERERDRRATMWASEASQRSKSPSGAREPGATRPSGSRASVSSAEDREPPNGKERKRSRSPDVPTRSPRHRSSPSAMYHDRIGPRPSSPRRSTRRDSLVESNETPGSTAAAGSGSTPVPTGPRAYASRAGPPSRSSGGIWGSRSFSAASRYGSGSGPTPGGSGQAAAERRRDEMPARSLARKRDSEGAPLVPDLAPIPSSSASGLASASHAVATDPVAASSNLDASYGWDDAPAAGNSNGPIATLNTTAAAGGTVNPYSGATDNSTTTTLTSTGTGPAHATAASHDTDIRSPYTSTHRHSLHLSTHSPSTPPLSRTASSYPTSIRTTFSSASHLLPELDKDLYALSTARRHFVAAFTLGPKRLAIRRAQYELRDSQIDLWNAKHRVQLCEQALEALKDEAEKYSLAENQKEAALDAAARSGGGEAPRTSLW